MIRALVKSEDPPHLVEKRLLELGASKVDQYKLAKDYYMVILPQDVYDAIAKEFEIELEQKIFMGNELKERELRSQKLKEEATQLKEMEEPQLSEAEQKAVDAIDRRALFIFRVIVLILGFGFAYGVINPDFGKIFMLIVGILSGIYILVFGIWAMWFLKYWPFSKNK